MALHDKKFQAILLRKKGMSYSQIKKELNVSKSSLSIWLRSMPLSKERISELRDWNEQRIERFRETMMKKREARLSTVRKKVAKKIGRITKRDLFIGGLFLYWGEGGKTKTATTTVSNTDPAVLVCFLEWLNLIGVPMSKVRVHVHLYSDMDTTKELTYWSKTLRIPLSQFRKPYVKSSKRSNISYTNKFSHGTCNVAVESRDVSEFTLSGFNYIREKFARGIES